MRCKMAVILYFVVHVTQRSKTSRRDYMYMMVPNSRTRPRGAKKRWRESALTVSLHFRSVYIIRTVAATDESKAIYLKLCTVGQQQCYYDSFFISCKGFTPACEQRQALTYTGRDHGRGEKEVCEPWRGEHPYWCMHHRWKFTETGFILYWL